MRRAGFPPGACNLLLHKPDAATGVVDACISHTAVKKINVTGSTAVGRSMASVAARHLKPVLLELGGKNVSIVLKDADLEKAARESLRAAVLNVRRFYLLALCYVRRALCFSTPYQKMHPQHYHHPWA